MAPSVRDIACNLGVSVATVSRALNNHANVHPETRQRVHAEAMRVGYSLKLPRVTTQTIALAYTGEQSTVSFSGFDGMLLDGILRGIDEQRFDVSILSIPRDKLPTETYRTFFARKGVSGVILRSFERTRHVCAEIAAEGLPAVVVADRFEESAGVNFVRMESRHDSRRAVEHLIHLGHRRIALAIHRVQDADHTDRRSGYREALEAHGVGADPALEVNLLADMNGGANAINYLLSLPEPPTAVYFTDPMATIGALHRCQALGVRVPQDLSIVGFDDSSVRYLSSPPFTAVCQDATRLGYESALWLTRRLSGVEKKDLRLNLPTTFEINQTTAGPRGGLLRAGRRGAASEPDRDDRSPAPIVLSRPQAADGRAAMSADEHNARTPSPAETDGRPDE